MRSKIEFDYQTVTHPKVQIKKKPVTYERVKKAYQYVAGLVTRDGEEFLPVFERLHQELLKFEEANKMISLALKITNGRK